MLLLRLSLVLQCSESAEAQASEINAPIFHMNLVFEAAFVATVAIEHFELNAFCICSICSNYAV